jgi:hypothetical protein
MMSALVLDAPSDTTRAEERQRLLSELLEAVKQCQIRFGGRAELATESHPRVAILCSRIEAALCHGLRSKPLVPKNNSALRYKQHDNLIEVSLLSRCGHTTHRQHLNSRDNGKLMQLNVDRIRGIQASVVVNNRPVLAVMCVSCSHFLG